MYYGIPHTSVSNEEPKAAFPVSIHGPRNSTKIIIHPFYLRLGGQVGTSCLKNRYGQHPLKQQVARDRAPYGGGSDLFLTWSNWQCCLHYKVYVGCNSSLPIEQGSIGSLPLILFATLADIVHWGSEPAGKLLLYIRERTNRQLTHNKPASLTCVHVSSLSDWRPPHPQLFHKRTMSTFHM